jgi:hypothetical protein
MTGQMCWLSKFGGNGELILHLRLDSYQSWKPYTSFAGLTTPDYPIPGGSKGYATSQKLLEAGWTLLSTAQARGAINPPKAA